MTFSFLLLLAAAGIFRFLAHDAKKAFDRRVAAFLPANVDADHVNVLLREFPQHCSEFRFRVLPFSAANLLMNAASCIAVVSALWICPPTGMSAADLVLLQYGGLIIVPLAFVIDFVGFFRLLFRTFRGEPGPEKPL